MGQRGRPKAELVLTADERECLTRFVRRHSSAQALALRSQIVLACAEGLTNRDVAAQLRVSLPTVGRWRQRFIERRLDGLSDDRRPGATRTIGDDRIEQVIVKTLEEAPKDATHWSTRSMAAKVGMSKSAINRIWKAFNLEPHKVQYWKLSTDPFFIEKVRDVVGIYLNPPEAAVVLCVDEKTQI